MKESLIPDQKERLEDFKQTCLQPNAIDGSVIAIVLLVAFIFGCGLITKLSF